MSTNRADRRESSRKVKSSEYRRQKPIVKIGVIILISGVGLAMIGSMLPNILFR